MKLLFAWKVVNPYKTKFYMNLQLSTRSKIPIQIYLSNFSKMKQEALVGRRNLLCFIHTI